MTSEPGRTAEAEAIQAAVRAVRARRPTDEAITVLILTRDRCCFRFDVPPQPAEHDGLFERPSGPAPPNLLVWRGRVEKLSRREYALVELLWADRTAPVEHAVEVIWGPGAEAGDSNLRSMVCRLNQKIARAGCALTVTLEAGHLVLG